MKDKQREELIKSITSVPVEWMEKHIKENYKPISAHDPSLTQEYSELGYACEMVLVNYRVDMMIEKGLWKDEEE